MYYSFDLRAAQHLLVDTIAGCMPLFAGIPGEEEAERLLGHLEFTGEGRGVADYSWTASLAIDLTSMGD